LSKNVAVFVDVANLYYSARGQDVDVDYVALLKAATKGRDLVRAYAYSGLDPENENQRKFIDFLGKNGYKVVHKDIRKFGDGRVKANLDIELVVDLFRVKDRMDIAVIVSGDGDFAPAIRALQDVGIRCEVISFRPNTSSDLIAVADEFTDIMKIASIGRDKTAKGMSAPPMPAKEVEPDFAFREASPAVAAAALAAIKGGGSTARGTRGRGRGNGNGHRRHDGTDAAHEEPTTAAGAVEVAAADAEHHLETENGNGEHRRRRRRGGRGRGRRGHGEEQEVAAIEGAVEEIGWQELDDLSQLGDLDEERDYAFEEADAATLAELGLTAAEVAEPQLAAASTEAATAAGEQASTEATPAETKPRARRSRTTKKAEAEPATSASDEAQATPRRRTRTGAKAQAEAEAADTTADQEGEQPKPRARRSRTAQSQEAAAPNAEQPADTGTRATRSRSRKAPAANPSARSEASDQSAGSGSDSASDGQDESGEPQGIWQRFRSARTTR
jgi:uncharacterized LabA/DUF88 family protein